MNVDKSIILLMNIYLSTIFVRLYKMNCDKHILTEKLNELLIQIFEKMLKKRYIYYLFFWFYGSIVLEGIQMTLRKIC